MAGTIVGTTVAQKGRGVVKIKAVLTTTDGTGVCTATTIGSAFGKLVGIGYKPGTLDTGTDITVTDSDSGATLFSLTNAATSARYFRPTAVITDNAGVAVAAATTAVDVNRDIYVAGKLKVAVAQAGATTGNSGQIDFIVEEV